MERSGSPWAPGPGRPLLPDGVLDVWFVDLATVPDDLCASLSKDELERAARMLGELAQRRWTRARAMLRALLGRYLQIEATQIGFAAGPHGKPALREDGPRGAIGRRAWAATSTLQFNLSHSGDLALYAFAAGCAVGVDVETDRHPRDELAIAARVLGDDEAARLRTLDPRDRRGEFLRAWVEHEARLKCLGLGLARAGCAAERAELWVAQLDVGSRAAGAVAAVQPPRELRRWSWPPRGGPAS